MCPKDIEHPMIFSTSSQNRIVFLGNLILKHIFFLFQDRLWRKNRSPTSANCYGVDMNRNWAYHWHDSGVSDIPCADTFPGSEAFSEIESRNMRDYFNNFYAKPDLTVCLHSAAELWLYPYGYAYNQYPPNVDDLVGMKI